MGSAWCGASLSLLVLAGCGASPVEVLIEPDGGDARDAAVEVDAGRPRARPDASAPVRFLEFVGSPSGGHLLAALPPVTVRVVDPLGNPVRVEGVPVTIEWLRAGRPVAGAGGVETTSLGSATFSGLAPGATGRDFQLRATAPGLEPGVTNFFDVDAPPTVLAFAPPPAARVVQGQSFGAFSVVLLDAAGAAVTNDDRDVTLSLQLGSSSLAGTLTGRTSGGRVTFADVTYSVAETIRLVASSPGLSRVAADVEVHARAPLERAFMPGGRQPVVAWEVSISRDGRFVVFAATGAVGGPPVPAGVFRWDRSTGRIDRASVGPNGQLGDGIDAFGFVSADGQRVAFMSTSTNYLPFDANGANADGFVRDFTLGTTTVISVDEMGRQLPHFSNTVTQPFSSDGMRAVLQTGYNLLGEPELRLWDELAGGTRLLGFLGDAWEIALSGDGRVLVLSSGHIVWPTGSIGHELHRHQLDPLSLPEVVSGPNDGGGVNGSAYGPFLSFDGSVVAFTTDATNLLTVPDRNHLQDVMVWDDATRALEKVSVGTGGVEARSPTPTRGLRGSVATSISDDGRFVVFLSDAVNLVPNDTNNHVDAFVHDRRTHVTERVSVLPGGTEGNGDVTEAKISGDGRTIVFVTEASNFSADTNRQVDVYVTESPLAP